MHDRAVRPAGAVKRAAAIAIEIMILLNTYLRIAQVTSRVEKAFILFVLLVMLILPRSARVVACAVLSE